MASSAPAPYDAIRRAIVEGAYRPGERLVEERLAARHGSSRTPVREALRRLEADGLVVSERHRGAVVRPVSPSEVCDLYELRAVLEGYAARRAAARITAAELAEIDDGIAAFDAAAGAAAAGDLDAIRSVNAANRQIHDVVGRAARHARLEQLLHRSVDLPLVFQAFRRFGPAELARSNQFHRLLRHALAQGDGPRAEALLTEHLAQGRDVLLADLADPST